MSKDAQYRPSQHLLVVMPSWVGDAVMATPTLRALRELFPKARITALARDTVRPVLDACPWVNRIMTIRRPRKGMRDGRRRGLFTLAARLGAGRFDTAVLLPNSFRAALLVALARIPRRIGYDRDGRGSLLTDRLLPRRAKGQFLPVPMIDYYLGIARYLGAANPDPGMAVFTRPEQDARVDRLLAAHGLPADSDRPLVILNPGANYGDAKIWPAERFAAVGDRCAQEFHAVLAVSGSPRERAILDQVLLASRHPVLDLPRLGIDLSDLKSVVRRAQLMITNDTGPRHIAAALGVPVVTVFGPTDPAWTKTGFAHEREVAVKVFCGPCQKKRCPLDHRCMTEVTPEMVFAQAQNLLRHRLPA